MTRLFTLVVFCLAVTLSNAQEFRSLSGVGNNLSNPEWGASESRMEVITSNGYADKISEPGGQGRMNPREVSNLLFSQDLNINDQLALSDYVWVFGQFVDHDITLVENAVTEPLFIPVPANDPMFDPLGTGQAFIPMFRSIYDATTGTSEDNPRVHMNAITAFVDASGIYGSDIYRANWLRSFNHGKLKSSEGNLLPYNTITGEFNDPKDQSAPFMADDLQSGHKLFVAGDIRANENLLLTSFHTLFMREHNRICNELKLKDPSFSDEMLYQLAKSKVTGLLQEIVFNEWLPAMGVKLPEYNGYDDNVNPGIFNVFSAAAFRLGHTLLSPTIKRMGPNGETISLGDISLRDAFFNPLEITRAGGIDPYFKGMGAQIQQDLDCKIIDDVRNFLFGAPGQGGLDLAAINIMRGRERGLPDFNTIRTDLGLEKAESFSQICSDGDVNIILEDIYASVDDIDPWVGMLAEDHMPKALFGETIMKLMELQFLNLRNGDRFYYEIDPGLSDEDLKEIKSTKFADIIRRNTDIRLMQDDVFFAMEHKNIPFANVEVVPVQLDVVTFPNPTTDALHFKIYLNSPGDLNINIFNASGTSLQTEVENVLSGENTFSIELDGNITSGVYYARISIGNDLKVIKFVKL